MDLDKISFHEASILAFQRENNDILLKIESVIVSEILCNANLKFFNVKSVSDGNQIILGNNFMLFDDGEILNFVINNGCLEMLIEWVDFKNKKDKIIFYKIEYEKYSLEFQ